jgi:hypothetical protein
MCLTDFGPEWTTVVYKKKKNKQIKKLLAETLEEALKLESEVPGLSLKIDPEKWQQSYKTVLDEYYKFLTSFSEEDIKTKIEKLKTSDHKYVRESPYVQFDCRKYYDGNELDEMSVNGYNFKINRFFGNDEFIKRLKHHYKLMGYNIGFGYRTENETKYTHLKVYFR